MLRFSIKLLNTKCVPCSTILSNTFLAQLRIQRDILINVKSLHVKYPLFLSDFNKTWIFLIDFFKKNLKYQVSSKSFQSVPSRYVQTDGRKDGQMFMTKPIAAFHNFANAPNKKTALFKCSRGARNRSAPLNVRIWLRRDSSAQKQESGGIRLTSQVISYQIHGSHETSKQLWSMLEIPDIEVHERPYS
jgi:hypothetical protein